MVDQKRPNATQIGYLRGMSPAGGRFLGAQGPRLAMSNKLALAGLAEKAQFGFRRTDLGEAAVAKFDTALSPSHRDILVRAVAGKKISVSEKGVSVLMQSDLLWISYTGEIRVREAAERLVASWQADDQVLQGVPK